MIDGLFNQALVLHGTNYIFKVILLANAALSLASIYIYNNTQSAIAGSLFAATALIFFALFLAGRRPERHRLLALTCLSVTLAAHTLCNVNLFNIELMVLTITVGFFSLFQSIKIRWYHLYPFIPATLACILILSGSNFFIDQAGSEPRWILPAASTANIAGFLLILRIGQNSMQLWIEQKRALLETKNREINDQHEKIKAVNDELTLTNYSLTSSITYAHRIQSSLLPSPEQLRTHFADHFVYMRPRDGVSGDFYWLFHYNNRIYFAVADCTGHGVPGALMSMMGSSILNQIVQSTLSDSPKLIMKYLDLQIIDMLSRSGKDMKEGMEMALIVIDYQNNKVKVSSANRPFLVARGTNLQEYRATKTFIGHSLTDKKPFEEITLDLSDLDTFYFFTDGITDQFNSSNEKKYSMRRLKQFISDFTSLELKEQSELLQKEIRAWMGSTPQTDDMLLVAIKLQPKRIDK